MRVQICAVNTANASQIQAGKLNVARKAGKKHIQGNTYKDRTWPNKIKDFISASRAASVMAKAHFESKQYSQAAILRKDTIAEQRSLELGRELTDREYDDLVWDSNGVQNRTTREDHVRYNSEFYSAKNGATKQNVKAHKISRVAHGLHGVTEMFSAPTGFTSIAVRNGVTAKPDDKSNKNRWFMTGILGFVGLASIYLISIVKTGAKAHHDIVENSFSDRCLDLMLSFPMVSSFFGLASTIGGVASQVAVQKQKMGLGQKESIQKDLTTNLNELLVHLKSVKGNPEAVKIFAEAMQGRHIIGKIKSNSLDAHKIPILLNDALEAVDLNRSDAQNLVSLKRAIGSYLQVENKPENGTAWQRYSYAKKVTEKESHYVALISTIDHAETRTSPDHLVDARRWVENKGMPYLHRKTLTGLGACVSKLETPFGTKFGETLKKWGSVEYQKKQDAKMADPKRASKNRFKGEYMAKHIHQYGPLTRALILTAEALRIFNMHIVLSSNANLSRVFNNATSSLYSAVATGPASRSMGQSVGRCLGGLALALIFGAAIPSGSGDVNINGTDIKYNFKNIGLLMFAVSVPTILVMCLAQAAARIEGWQGDIAKQIPQNKKTYQF